MTTFSTLRPSPRTARLSVWFSAIALLGIWPRPVRGQDAPPSSSPIFSAQLVDGRAASGRLTGIAVDGSLSLVSAEGAVEDVPLTKLIKLTRETPPLKMDEEGAVLIFPDGDRLCRISIGSAADNSLDVTSHLLGKLKIPLDSVLGLILAPPAERDDFDMLRDRVRHETRASEVVWMLNGDRRTGGFLAIDDRSVKLQVETRQVEIDRSGVIALGFDPSLVEYPRPQVSYLEVLLVEGTRLGLTECQLDRGRLAGKTRFGLRIQFPLADVDSMYARSNAFEYLSDREVAGVQYVAYIGPTRPYRIDRAVDGRRLELSGRSYERGLGTQSRTLLAYKLKPGDQRFQALVGLDDRAGPFGSVAFRVLVDGKERFSTPAMSSRDQPKAIDVNLAGAKTLILITEFGDRGDVQDLADWVEARIIHELPNNLKPGGHS
jgi:hypothetical protein